MRYLLTYDVNTTDKQGRKRLRKIAQACLDHGQRVQYSVFELDVTPTVWVKLRANIVEIVDEEKDSVRIYPLDEDTFKKVEHIGCKQPVDLDGLLIA